MTVHFLDDLDVTDKHVLVRVDYNTPMIDGAITDDGRIRASLPTLNHLIQRGCGVTLMSHLGRPKGKVRPEFSLTAVAQRCGELINRPVHLVPHDGQRPELGEVQLLENLRFSPGETANDPAFAGQLAQFGDVYINDAFGTAHRAHASTVGVIAHMNHFGAGFLLKKEIHYLEDALKQPQRPFVAIMGGSKVSDKIGLIRNLIPRLDRILIGGAMAYTFLRAKGIAVGDSRVEAEFLEEAVGLLDLAREKGVEVSLPLDHVIAKTFAADADATITLHQDIATGHMGLDIGPETIHAYSTTIKEAGTVVWNGPMGVFEWDTFSTGTITMAEALADSPALSIVGGGDSAAAIRQAELADQITHISTGGGAALELLSGTPLPGLMALDR